MTFPSQDHPMAVRSDLARDLERRLNEAILERDELKRWTSVNGVAELIAENERMEKLMAAQAELLQRTFREREDELVAEIARLRSQLTDSQA